MNGTESRLYSEYMPAPLRLARTGRAWLTPILSIASGFGVLSLAGCTERDSNLIAAGTNGVAIVTLPQAVIDAIDERPLGGASLTSGTTGGGNYSDARANGTLFLVNTLDDLKARVSGDAPAIVVVKPGAYTGAGAERTVQACHQACAPDDPIAEGTLPAADCTHGEALFDVTLNSDVLRIGSNKTIIGLDAGSHLVNVSVSLDGSSNVILRNLAIESLDSDLSLVDDGLSMDPAHHIWLDHLSTRDVSNATLPIVSTWDQDQNQALVDESGYITISNAHFDGLVRGSCSQRSELVLTTNRNPAITITRSWFARARIRAPNLFGPGTWAHLYNNLWTDIDGRGLAVSCGATAIAQGNVFQAAHNALYNSDSGPPDWQFCAAGFFGNLYAPTGAAGVETNSLDAASSMSLMGQPTTGVGVALPESLSGTDYEITVPVDSGTDTQTYRVTLAPDPSTIATDVPATAGVGHLF
jgi:pectate lyase